jgi:hypothetical protein
VFFLLATFGVLNLLVMYTATNYARCATCGWSAADQCCRLRWVSWWP